MLTNVLLKSCWVALALLVVCIPILFVACQKSNDDYYAEARVRLVLPDSLRLEKLQGTVRLTNLNNKQSFTTSTLSLSLPFLPPPHPAKAIVRATRARGNILLIFMSLFYY